MEQMEKKFLHERLRSPDTGLLKYWKTIYDAFNSNSKTDKGNLDTSEFLKIAKKNGLKKETVEKLITASDGVISNVAVWLASKLIKDEVTPHVFLADFFKIIIKANISKIKWSMIPDDFSWIIRFPDLVEYPSDDPSNKMSFNEVYIRSDKFTDQSLHDSFDDIDPSKGDRVISMYCIGKAFKDGQSTEVGLMKTLSISRDDSFIVDHEYFHSNIDQSFVFFIMKCLVYINSGNPDLREFKNPIRYRSEGSSTPVREHKQYSIPAFKVVGFNWKKQRLQHVDSWGVEPYMRYQPYGPGRSEYKYVMVKEHTRSHRKPFQQADETHETV